MDIGYFSKNRKKYISPDIKGLYCLGDKNRCSHFEEDGAKRIPWGKRPSLSEYNLLEKLHILPNKKQVKNRVLPSFIRDLINLKFLNMPLPYVENIEESTLPVSISSLMITNTYEYNDLFESKDIIWPYAILPFIKALFFVGDYEPSMRWIRLGIHRDHFPALEYLKTFVDEKGVVLDSINRFDSLRFLEIEMLYNHDVFSAINSSLLGLEISATKSKFPVSNLFKMETLQMLKMKGIKSEIDCNVFLSLPKLIEIEIYNSKKITNIELLLKCKKLETVTLVNCGKPLNKKNKKRFLDAGFEKLDIDYA